MLLFEVVIDLVVVAVLDPVVVVGLAGASAAVDPVALAPAA